MLVDEGDHIVGAGDRSDVRASASGLPDAAFELSVADSTRVRRLEGGPSVSVDGIVIGSDWEPVPSGARIRVGRSDLLVRRSALNGNGRSAGRLLVLDPDRGRMRIDVTPGGEVAFNRPPRRGGQWRPRRSPYLRLRPLRAGCGCRSSRRSSPSSVGY